MQISLVIPAYNEEESIGQVLSSIPQNVVDEIIVVDGGSTDKTVFFTRQAGAQVIIEPRRGYGRACNTGLNNASGDVVVFMDADGADDPSQISDLIEPIENGGADLVLGSRLAEGIDRKAMPYHQRFGNTLSGLLIQLLYSLQITDLSPFRAISREKLLALDMQEMTYGWPTEMIVKAKKSDYKIIEIPVNYSPRIGGRSKISGTVKGTLLATYYILGTIFRYTLAQ